MTKTAMKKDPPVPAPLVPRASRRGPKAFFTEVMRELRKVEWTNGREVNRLTLVVLIVCAFVVGILWLLSEFAGTLVNLLQGKG